MRDPAIKACGWPQFREYRIAISQYWFSIDPKTDGNPSSARWMDVHLPNSDKLVQLMRRNALEER